MLKFLFSKKVRLIGGLILFGGFYAFHFRKVDSTVYETHMVENLTIAPTHMPITNEPEEDLSADSLLVRGSSLNLGDSTDQVLKAFGAPGRIDVSEYGYDYYIYNNDYSRMAFIAIQKNKVVGFYTDSTDLSFHNIKYGDSLEQINKAFEKNYSLDSILSYETETYTAKILMDQLETNTVTGIYVLSKNVDPTFTEDIARDYSEDVIHNKELMSYDLVNSMRKRHELKALSWSSSAGTAARKHSAAMASKDFFSHIDPERRTPGGRLFAEGIGYSDCSENIIGGYEDAILANHGFYNSRKQRQNILSSKYRYMGAGFAYDPKSKYRTYFTQVIYR